MAKLISLPKYDKTNRDNNHINVNLDTRRPLTVVCRQLREDEVIITQNGVVKRYDVPLLDSGKIVDSKVLEMHLLVDFYHNCINM